MVRMVRGTPSSTTLRIAITGFKTMLAFTTAKRTVLFR